MLRQTYVQVDEQSINQKSKLYNSSRLPALEFKGNDSRAVNSHEVLPITGNACGNRQVCVAKDPALGLRVGRATEFQGSELGDEGSGGGHIQPHVFHVLGEGNLGGATGEYIANFSVLRPVADCVFPPGKEVKFLDARLLLGEGLGGNVAVLVLVKDKVCLVTGVVG